MIEVYPKRINEEKLQANLQKLVTAFIMFAEEQVKENESPLTTLTETDKAPVNL